jgi:anti-sigma B factor antagonist
MTTTDERRVVDLDPGELGIVITSTESGGGTTSVIAVAGEIDAATAPRLAACFGAVAAGRPGTITVDLTGVPFMDSSGVNALVDLCALATAWGGTLVITGAAANVRRVCDLTRIEDTEGLVLR